MAYQISGCGRGVRALDPYSRVYVVRIGVLAPACLRRDVVGLRALLSGVTES